MHLKILYILDTIYIYIMYYIYKLHFVRGILNIHIKQTI